MTQDIKTRHLALRLGSGERVDSLRGGLLRFLVRHVELGALDANDHAVDQHGQ